VFAFLRRLPFIVHLLIVLGLAFLIIFGFTYYLDSYTRHGKVREVPDVSKKNLKEAMGILKGKGFDVTVDSTYRDSLPPLYIIKQSPEGGEKVKAGRTIYLVVNKASVPLVDMPNLLGASVNSALHLLERANLRLKDTVFKPDFAVGRVLQQMIGDKEIKAGSKVPFGSGVTMVIGSGLGGIVSDYPDFWGMTLKDAYAKLDELGLSRGAIVVDAGTKDSLKAYVYKQNPPRIDPYNQTLTLVRQGNAIDLFVSDIQRAKENDSLFNMIDKTELQEVKEEDKKNKLVPPKKPADDNDKNKQPKPANKPNTPPAAKPPSKPVNVGPNEYDK
jgi:eukaryotic-like serine/threonine-protein kinase